jgi:hypothetical protein
VKRWRSWAIRLWQIHSPAGDDDRAPTSGQLLLEGHDAGTADATLRKRLSAGTNGLQNPFASLNPRKKVGTLLAEPLAINTKLTASGAPGRRVRNDGEGRIAAGAL